MMHRETTGWLIFGGVAVLFMYWITRTPKGTVTVSSVAKVPGGGVQPVQTADYPDEFLMELMQPGESINANGQLQTNLSNGSVIVASGDWRVPLILRAQQMGITPDQLVGLGG